MKALSRISTAVLLCLILAAPAAAERFKQTINISVSPNPTIGSTSSHNPLTYKVEGETERAETYVVYMHVLGLPEEAACPAEPNGNYQQITIPEVKVHESSIDPKHFEGKGTFPWNTYEQKGEYRICAYLRYKGEHAIEDETVISTTVLTVTESYAEAVAKEEAAAKRKAEEEAAASADTVVNNPKLPSRVNPYLTRSREPILRSKVKKSGPTPGYPVPRNVSQWVKKKIASKVTFLVRRSTNRPLNTQDLCLTNYTNLQVHISHAPTSFWVDQNRRYVPLPRLPLLWFHRQTRSGRRSRRHKTARRRSGCHKETRRRSGC